MKNPSNKVSETAASKKQAARKSTKQVKAVSQVKTIERYALQATPRGKALFTYMLAVLSVAGMFTSGRKQAKKSAIRPFFASNTAISHHTKNGNIEETASGNIRLTVTGWNYFSGRLNGSTVGQEVDTAEMKALETAIKAGQLKEKTARFATSTKFKKVDIPA